MKNIVFIFLLLFSLFLIAQEEEKYIFKGQSTVFLETGGTSGTPISIQYDRVLFVGSEGYLNASLGFGTFFKDDLDYFTIPSSINYTIGVKKSHFEIGIPIIYRKTKTNKHKKEHLFYGLKLAYKYQAKEKLFLKITTNFLGHYELKNTSSKDCGLLGCAINWEKLHYLLGLSLGYSF